jgi:hypothetical protein
MPIRDLSLPTIVEGAFRIERQSLINLACCKCWASVPGITSGAVDHAESKFLLKLVFGLPELTGAILINGGTVQER